MPPQAKRLVWAGTFHSSIWLILNCLMSLRRESLLAWKGIVRAIWLDYQAATAPTFPYPNWGNFCIGTLSRADGEITLLCRKFLPCVKESQSFKREVWDMFGVSFINQLSCLWLTAGSGRLPCDSFWFISHYHYWSPCSACGLSVTSSRNKTCP